MTTPDLRLAAVANGAAHALVLESSPAHRVVVAHGGQDNLALAALYHVDAELPVPDTAGWAVHHPSVAVTMLTLRRLAAEAEARGDAVSGERWRGIALEVESATERWPAVTLGAQSR